MGTTWNWYAPMPAETGSKSERRDRSSLDQAEAQGCQVATQITQPSEQPSLD